jgi:hypothetical protein
MVSSLKQSGMTKLGEASTLDRIEHDVSAGAGQQDE